MAQMTSRGGKICLAGLSVNCLSIHESLRRALAFAHVLRRANHIRFLQANRATLETFKAIRPLPAGPGVLDTKRLLYSSPPCQWRALFC